MTEVSGLPADEARAGERLASRIGEIRHALDLGGDRITPEVRRRAFADLERVESRLARGIDRTVVALVGGTGSGKSSLFNAISRLAFAEVGVRRPTTEQASACVWGGPADGLLDFLQVRRERRITRESALDGDRESDLNGLVLLDMPDHDSIAPEHALLVERLLPLVDLLVWVVDPQKYADNVLHERYLRAMAERRDAMLVLVNQVDTIPPSGADRIRADVRRLLDEDGLHDVPVLATSVKSGVGLRDVRDALVRVVAGESVAARVAGVEVAAVARRVAADLGGSGAVPRVETLDATATGVVERLSRACGVDAVEDAIRGAVASPRPRLALASPEAPSVAIAAGVRAEWVSQVSRGLPSRWAAELDGAVGSGDDLARALGRRLDRVPLPSTEVVSGWLWAAPVSGGLAAVAAIWGVLTLRAAGVVLGIALAALTLAFAVLEGWTRRRVAVLRAREYRDGALTAVAAVVGDVLVAPTARLLGEYQAVRGALVGGPSGASAGPLGPREGRVPLDDGVGAPIDVRGDPVLAAAPAQVSR